ncbi:reticulocyte-binding protein homolog 2a-like isoform X2 [Saccostrea echinata]|uniref:reticulocyte-binding protein homolog 2a-like isoform X2 n=1 Tax=Saccostrea echinata TaxID=191078 RepID=UPI002A8197EF|nr:reticulocyte-binding protein homolog 2a-like isoform X2 [Saccostrea echinata]
MDGTDTENHPRDNIQEFLNAVENRKFFEGTKDIDGKDLSAKLAQLSQAKTQIKEAFSLQTVSKEMFLKYLCQDFNSWPTQQIQSEDPQMQEVTQKLKSCKGAIEQEKATATELAACAEDGYEMLKSKISSLKDILLKREQKRKELQDLRNKMTGGGKVSKNLKEVIQKQKDEKVQVDAEIAMRQASLSEAKASHDRLQQDVAALQEKLKRQEEEIHKSHSEAVKKQTLLTEKIKQETELCEYIRKLSGIREIQTEDTDSMCLGFVHEEEEDPSLILTMNLAADPTDRVYLKGAEVNVQSLPTEDLIRVAVQKNDPVWLVHSLRELWISYHPIVSEVKKLSERHAVDWIQEEGVVRVLMGKRGTVICTLSVPKTYPQEGNVSLVSVHGGYGEENTMDVDETVENKTLQQWVDYLEAKYGNC